MKAQKAYRPQKDEPVLSLGEVVELHQEQNHQALEARGVLEHHSLGLQTLLPFLASQFEWRYECLKVEWTVLPHAELQVVAASDGRFHRVHACRR
jgi:hypothetical protein